MGDTTVSLEAKYVCLYEHREAAGSLAANKQEINDFWTLLLMYDRAHIISQVVEVELCLLMMVNGLQTYEGCQRKADVLVAKSK